MPSKLQTYMQMADEAQRQITGSYRGWTGFLTTAARLYKYPYAEQVMISLLRYTSNNINQIAKRLNESGRAYDTDLAEILEKQKQLWGLANKILMKLSAIQ